ncbi:hypothetical protein D9M71_556910 [compost metagenome]
MATKHYGAYSDRRNQVKNARKLSEDMACDTFVTATVNGKYQVWYADSPGDRPLSGYTVVEEFKYVPPIPPVPFVDELSERLESLRRVPENWPAQFKEQLLDLLDLIVQEVRKP